jgi:hypothetical protein
MSLTAIGFMLLAGCEKSDSGSKPEVITGDKDNLTKNSVTLYGEITEDHGEEIVDKGFVYFTDLNHPENSKPVSTREGGSLFQAVVSGLSPATRYYYRAYAENNSGVAYGESREFTTLDEDGMTEDINNIVPKDVQDEMEDLGISLNGGGNPPNIAGSFLMSPLILVETTIPNDFELGHLFSDVYFRFSEQDNNNLTIKFEYVFNSEEQSSGEGTGAFITGSGNDFSVFVENLQTDEHGHRSRNVQVYSGTVTSSGIRDLYMAIFMIDDGGDPDDNLIENGQGRLFYDSDRFSERISETRSKKLSDGVSRPLILQSK